MKLFDNAGKSCLTFLTCDLLYKNLLNKKRLGTTALYFHILISNMPN